MGYQEGTVPHLFQQGIRYQNIDSNHDIIFAVSLIHLNHFDIVTQYFDVLIKELKEESWKQSSKTILKFHMNKMDWISIF